MKLRVLGCVCMFASLVIAAGAPASASADDSAVNDSGKTLELSCGEGGKVAINGSKNEITITGNCAAVAINGSMNDIEIEGVDKIAVNGAGNTVAWQHGWKKKAPRVAKHGRNNRVTKGS